jgi:hypothetical protein
LTISPSAFACKAKVLSRAIASSELLEVDTGTDTGAKQLSYLFNCNQVNLTYVPKRLVYHLSVKMLQMVVVVEEKELEQVLVVEQLLAEMKK